MEMFYKDLKNQTMKIMNYWKKEMILLTNEEKESYEKQKVCYMCGKEFSRDKKIVKSKIIAITQKNLEELLIIFVI